RRPGWPGRRGAAGQCRRLSLAIRAAARTAPAGADAAGNHATCVMASHADRREARSQQPRGDGHDRPDLMAATTSRQETGAPGGPPGHKQKEKTMIFHINRMTFKPGLSQEQRRACLEVARQAGAANPAVKSYVVGPELGGEFEYSFVYVVEDLDGY